MKNSQEKLMLRFRAVDTPAGLTRDTWKKVATRLGVSETEAIHIAMVGMAEALGVVHMQKPLPFSLDGYDLKAMAKVLKQHAPELFNNSENGNG